MMIKHLVMTAAAILLVACTTHDEQYYRINPQALQQDLKNCPNVKPRDLSCDELKSLAIDINQLAYELQMNPQGFGTKIMSLQVELINQQSELKKNPKRPELENAITTTKEQLARRLAIVKWLESPGS